MKIITNEDFSLDEIQLLAQQLIAAVAQQPAGMSHLILLEGDLGVGKTTLVKSLGQVLGIKEIITSPTFAILKKYEIENNYYHTLIHIDAYRIDDENELRPLQFEELIKVPNQLVCIEWPGRIANALPPYALTVTLNIKDEKTRTVQLSQASA